MASHKKLGNKKEYAACKNVRKKILQTGFSGGEGKREKEWDEGRKRKRKDTICLTLP